MTIHLSQLTLEQAAANIAFDEALLERAEATPAHPEVLRIWEPRENMVVVGRSSPIEREVNLDFCQRHNIPVFRRCSGGASIVTGPGCLMYAVLLDYRGRENLRMLEQAHQFVIDQLRLAVGRIGLEVQMQGTSDLTYQDKKFSGNSLRCKRNWMLYHGTILCDFNLQLIADCLGSPRRQPEYRRGRNHTEFLTLLPTDPHALRQAMIEQWSATEMLTTWSQEMTARLTEEKYLSDEWTYKVR